VVVGALSAGQAQAVIVNVNGQNWNVTTFAGTYNANTSKFATPANGGVMPWFGDQSLAGTFAQLVGSGLGLPNSSGNQGPYFGHGTTTTQVTIEYFDNPQNVVDGGTTAKSNSRTWAQAELVPPVPGPLPLFGAAAAFGFSRKLRQRIKIGTNSVSSSYNL
jgi:hypothetical protein